MVLTVLTGAVAGAVVKPVVLPVLPAAVEGMAVVGMLELPVLMARVGWAVEKAEVLAVLAAAVGMAVLTSEELALLVLVCAGVVRTVVGKADAFAVPEVTAVVATLGVEATEELAAVGPCVVVSVVIGIVDAF